MPSSAPSASTAAAKSATGAAKASTIASQGMNLLAAIIIFWNTMKLSEIVDARSRQGHAPQPELLAHVAPLGWEQINLAGEYRWPNP